jgi:meso-butanediol dehydrogenase/(S,S)-butanediol dehydrogenase/diacetyl reductase
MEIKGKTVIVTGAARGIGRGIATAFAREGARIVIADLGSLAGRSAPGWDYKLAAKEELSATVEALRTSGAEAVPVEVDVTDAASCTNMIEAAKKAFGGVDILVNNAGLVKAGPIVMYEEADWDRLFAVNVKGIFLASKAAIPEIIGRGGGVILNIASVAGRRGFAGMAAYCSSKFAVVGFTQAMAAELAPLGVRVSAICPGLLATAMWMDHLSGVVGAMSGKAAGREAFDAFVSANTPLGREQTPEDIAEAALYLARADNVTGVALTVAGGMES